MKDYEQALEEIKNIEVKSKIIKNFFMSLTIKDLKLFSAKVKELATAYGRKEEDLNTNEDLIKRIEETVKSDKAIALLIENAKVKNVEEKQESNAKKEEKEKSSTKTEKKSTEKNTKK